MKSKSRRQLRTHMPALPSPQSRQEPSGSAATPSKRRKAWGRLMNPAQNQPFFSSNQLVHQEVTNRVADFIKQRYSGKARQSLDPRGDLNLDNAGLDSIIDRSPLDVLKSIMGDSWSAVVDGVLADPEALLLLAA